MTSLILQPLPICFRKAIYFNNFQTLLHWDTVTYVSQRLQSVLCKSKRREDSFIPLSGAMAAEAELDAAEAFLAPVLRAGKLQMHYHLHR